MAPPWADFEFDPRRAAQTAKRTVNDGVQYASSLVARAAPFAQHAAVSAVAYTATLATVQASAFALRVSCATPALAPAVGVLGITLASAVSGQASAAWGTYRREGPTSLEPKRWMARVQMDDLVLDAVLGAALFVAMGGRFRSILPSDVRYVGALARESLPAAGSAYATDIQRAELRLLFRRHGCHHCGKRFGPVIADHQPPNKTVYGSTAAAVAAAAAQKVADDNPFVVFSRLLASPKVKQRFFPQCESCSSLQSDALRRGIKKMVAHFGGVQPYAYAGVLVGLRQYSAEEVTTGSKPGSKAGGKAGSSSSGGGGSTTLDKWLADARRALR